MKPLDMHVLEELIGSQNVISDAKRLTSGSKDCYHFSPVLKPQLDGCLADAIVKPEDQEQLVELIAWAAKNKNSDYAPRRWHRKLRSGCAFKRRYHDQHSQPQQDCLYQ